MQRNIFSRNVRAFSFISATSSSVFGRTTRSGFGCDGLCCFSGTSAGALSTRSLNFLPFLSPRSRRFLRSRLSRLSLFFGRSSFSLLSDRSMPSAFARAAAAAALFSISSAVTIPPADFLVSAFFGVSAEASFFSNASAFLSALPAALSAFFSSIFFTGFFSDLAGLSIFFSAFFSAFTFAGSAFSAGCNFFSTAFSTAFSTFFSGFLSLFF